MTKSRETEKSSPAIASGVRERNALELGQIPLLRDLDSMTLETIESHLQIRKIDRGAYVVHKGSPGDHLLFVLSGRLQAVDITDDGQEIGLSFLDAGDYFGEISIIDGLPRSASVVACENSIVGQLAKLHAQTLIYQHPRVAERVLKRLAAGLRKASFHQAVISLPNAFQRVFTLLEHMAHDAPGGLRLIDKIPKQQEIAIMANTSRETVSRAINALIEQGAVHKDRRRLIVRKPDFLRGAALGKIRFSKYP